MNAKGAVKMAMGITIRIGKPLIPLSVVNKQVHLENTGNSTSE